METRVSKIILSFYFLLICKDACKILTQNLNYVVDMCDVKYLSNLLALYTLKSITRLLYNKQIK